MRNSTVTVRGTGGIDTRDFRQVARSLYKARGKMGKDLRKRLRNAGEIMAVEARSIASEHSETIPPTAKVRVAGATVAVVAGGKGVAIAGLFELGNTGASKAATASRGGHFRHPVFGDRTQWVSQEMHRYMAPAYDATRGRVHLEILKTVHETTDIIVKDKGV